LTMKIRSRNKYNDDDDTIRYDTIRYYTINVYIMNIIKMNDENDDENN
jgi:hypothetical protein